MASADMAARAVLERLLHDGGEALDSRTGNLSVMQLHELARTRAIALESQTPPMRHRMNRKLYSLGVPLLALYQTLREQGGLDQPEAVALLDALLQAAYRTRLASPVARAVAGGMFRLPIIRSAIARAAERSREPGGFVMRRVAASDGELLALDVERCPLAELFARHGAPEIGPLLCKIDDLMADAIPGVTLHRTGTIAAGSARCDFRYRKS